MTDPFMRVDLSQASRDFQPVALEPGLPLLDRSNSNGQTLRKWLGAFVAEPERVGDRATFYVRDDEGRRIDSVFCVPVSDKDLAGELAKDFRELLKRIEAAKPQSPNEQLIHRVVIEQVRSLGDEANARDRRCCLFKFRDGKNKLHLVWSPGYRRRDNEPAAPLVCTNPTCSHLFLQRRDSGAKCPVCQAIRKETAGQKAPRSLAGFLAKLLAFLFFIGLGVGGTIWWQQRQQHLIPPVVTETSPLTVEPANWSGPMDSRVEFIITRHDGASPHVVTASAAVTVANPKVLSVKPYENIGKALSPGKTDITFFVGALTAKASVTVELPERPTKLLLQPEKLELGVGTTAQVKLIGEYAGGRQADLTDAAEWEARHDEKFFVHKGRVEGEEAGTGTLHVRYRASESTEPIEATAEVVVRDYEYKALKLLLEPGSPTVGRPAKIRAVATTETGTDLTVDESKDLTINVSPAERATVRGSALTSLAEGDVKLTAQFRGLSATLDAKIGKSDGVPRPLEVSPNPIELKLGELARLSVLSAQPQSVQLKSAKPDVVEVTADGRVIGRGVGSTEIEVSDGGDPIKIAATVTAAEWKSIALEPARVSIHALESATVRIFGVVDESNRVELAPDQVTWVTLPRSEFVDFERASLQVKGLKLTGDRPERLTARRGDAESTSEIQVVPAPLVLTLAPAGSLEIPLGQKRRLQVQAQYGGAPAEDVPPDRVEWVLSSEVGFDLKNGEIHAKAENAQIRLSAKYQGTTSNEVRVASVPATPLTLHVTAQPSTLAVGETGVVLVTATGPGGEVAISEDGLLFASEKPNVLQIGDTTGAFRAGEPGTTTIRVSHVAAKQPVETSITVTPSNQEPRPKPASLRLVSTQGNPITLPVEAEFSDWKVEAVGADGSVTDVSKGATLVVDGDSTKSTLSGLLERAAQQLQLNLETEPSKAGVVIRNGRIVGVNAGEATVHAVYGSIRTTEGLRVQVTSALEIDEIRLSPSEIRLVVGESATVQAVGYKNGKSVGDITNRTELVWKSKEEGPVQADGPQLTANRSGQTSVTAQLGPVVSKPANVSVVEAKQNGATPPEVGTLMVVPSRLRMKTGEVARVGHEIVVKRQETDFSEQCEVAAPANRIVAYQEESRSLLASSPGRTRVTFIVGNQSAVLDVEVVPEVIPAADSSIVIEPSTGRLAVGERLSLRAFVVTADGTRSPVTAALTSDNRDVAIIVGSAIQGVAPGEVTVEARVPGIDLPGKAVFQVEVSTVERLVFIPATLSVAVGQRKSFEVYAVTPQGRKKLGDDPNLKLSVSDADGKIIELTGPSREVFGLQPGTASVVATWKDGLERRLPVTVRLDPIQELVIQPSDATVEEGQTIDFQVFARRGGRLQPLQALDGVELFVANPVLASPEKSDLRVAGLKVGKTQVGAKFGSRRAVAQLTVTPRQIPKLPDARAVGLRFIPDLFRLEMGTPGDSIRVVRVLADGTEEDVDHLVTLSVRDPQDVIEIENSKSGPIVRPKRIGQTQIDASLDTLRTQKPLLVDVAEKIAQQARLRTLPPTLQLEVGQTGSFQRAEVLPASGRNPIPVPFKVSATPNQVFEVLPDGSIRAKSSPGQAVCTVTANDPEGKYEGLSTSVSVEVTDPNRPGVEESISKPRLVVTGPSEMTVGAEVNVRVQIDAGSRATDVTSRAQLVLVAGEETLAEVRPGGVILAKGPGRLHVQARLDEMTSAPHEIVIRPVDKDFERLELEVARGRMAEHETRAYQLWGYPRGGGTRQDLTKLVTEDESNQSLPHMRLQTLLPNAGTKVVEHRPGTLTSRQPGRFSLQARLGERLATETIALEIFGGPPDAPERMRIEPDQLQLLVGETTPPLKVLVASQGDRTFRTLDPSVAEVTTSNSEILQAKDGGQFTALKPGQAKIKVVYGGLEQSVPVTVKFNPFANIAVDDPKFADSTLTVNLTVTTNATDAQLEYRATLPNSDGRRGTETNWVAAEREGNQLSVSFRSPKIPLIRGQQYYTVMIEAKNLKTGTIERRPFAFRLKPISGDSKPAVEK